MPVRNLVAGLPSRLAAWLLLLLLISATQGHAQTGPDTLRIPLQEAEQRFMEKNLSLIAARYNIDINKALLEQAKLWDNPTLVTDQNIYTNHKFFEHGKDANGQPLGQYYIQVQQLIKTAGKRGKYIQLAATNVSLARLQFNEVMRNLKYQLRTDYYTAAQLQAVHQLYEQELASLQALVSGMNAQLQAGNIARKDFLRIQALMLTMQQDMAENDRQLTDTEAELRTLLQVDNGGFVSPTITPQLDRTSVPGLSAVLDSAFQYNSAYAIEQMQLQYQQQNLSYQRSLRAPDITVGPEYDHNSNYTPHYVGLGISLPLNIFNKNQGNIKAAQIAVLQETTNVSQVRQQLTNSVQAAIEKLNRLSALNGPQQSSFYSDYEQMLKNMTDSYRQRQLSLLEFIDFFEAYRDTRLKYLQQVLNVQLAREEINYLAGNDIIR